MMAGELYVTGEHIPAESPVRISLIDGKAYKDPPIYGFYLGEAVVPDYARGEGGPVRMLVQHADGWKVWGSVAKEFNGVQRGAVVEFDAAVVVSDRDTKFGFFSRPTKARKLETVA